MSTSEWIDFLASVEAEGIKEPLRVTAERSGPDVVDAGSVSESPGAAEQRRWVVLDGRHRLRAALKLGLATVPCLAVDLGGQSEVDYLVDAALLRRHLSASQRAALAVDLDFYRQEQEEARERVLAGAEQGAAVRWGVDRGPPPTTERRKSRDAVGERVGVSGRLIQRALKVKREAPDLHKLVKQGEISLREALKRVRGRAVTAEVARDPGAGVYTSHLGTNADLIAEVARLYLRPGDRVCDPTYGRGVFWSKVEVGEIDLVASDLLTVPDARHDFRSLPYEDASFDVFVLDP
ncbi:MAG: ParB N-terminal domain-containing protein, partial [Planctomycetes bacterium]|nr:ParB N-terminal domain-containing protein [Planctomycetota bacterium]